MGESGLGTDAEWTRPDVDSLTASLSPASVHHRLPEPEARPKRGGGGVGVRTGRMNDIILNHILTD